MELKNISQMGKRSSTKREFLSLSLSEDTGGVGSSNFNQVSEHLSDLHLEGMGDTRVVYPPAFYHCVVLM